MTRVWLLLRVGLRALWRTVRQPLPHPSWTPSQALAVPLVRGLLEAVSGRPGEVQRRALDAPPGRPPADVTVEQIQLGGRPALR